MNSLVHASRQVVQEGDTQYAFERWTISNPSRGNGLGPTLAKQLQVLLEAIRQKTSEIRAVLITAEAVLGPRGAIWIAGGDLKELANLTNPSDVLDYARTMRCVCNGLAALDIPVIVAADGAVIGGGAEFFLSADVRIATSRTSLQFRQLEVGLPTGYAGASRLVNLVGLARAQSLLYLAEPLDAQAALNAQLFHKVCAPGDLEDTIEATMKSLLAKPYEALRAQKRMLNGNTVANRWCDQEFMEAWRNPLHSRVLDDFVRKRGSSKD